MGTILNWIPPDSEKNYKLLNRGRLNYRKDEIEYRLNSLNYRCDEFDLESEFPILFMGCSFTEGIGLPLNEVWAYHLHSSISNAVDKKIPFWSMAKGGTSIDYSARCLYEHVSKIKPKYIFYLMSGISRREFCLDSPSYFNWYPNPTKLHIPSEKFESPSKIFSDKEFALYQTKRSLMILNSIATIFNIKIFIFDMEWIDLIPKEKKIDLFNKFDRIEYFLLGDLFNKFPVQDENIPAYIKSRPLFARDNSHPGAKWQYKTYFSIWNQIKYLYYLV